VQTVFDDVWLQRWNFGHLMTIRIGIITRQRLTAVAALLGPAVDGFVDAFGRHQRPLVSRMLRLSAPLPAAGRLRRFSLAAGRVGR
jgi:hypothetical protein